MNHRVNGCRIWLCCLVLISSFQGYESVESPSSAAAVVENIQSWFSIEGKIYPADQKITPPTSTIPSNNEWLSSTQVLLNGGEHVGLLNEDGSFSINGVPSGSYIVEAVNPQYAFEPVRVDITSKGKVRARKVNHLQPNQVTHIPYPLKLSPVGMQRYFQAREQWRITDVLLSPMVLTMVLPLLLIVILPKMMSDPETRKEMESVSLPKYEMPEMSEMLTSFFGGGSASKGAKAIKSKKN